MMKKIKYTKADENFSLETVRKLTADGIAKYLQDRISYLEKEVIRAAKKGYSSCYIDYCVGMVEIEYFKGKGFKIETNDKMPGYWINWREGE